MTDDANKAGQKIVRDQRGQDQPADKQRAQRHGGGLRGDDKRQGDLQDASGGGTLKAPEGLKRKRQGPLNKRSGRGAPRVSGPG